MAKYGHATTARLPPHRCSHIAVSCSAARFATQDKQRRLERKGDVTMTNPLRELEALGQSVWLDDIDRVQLRSGLFERLINEDGLSGATGNPTIFEHAIDH